MDCIAFRRNQWGIDLYDQHGKYKVITLPKGITKTEDSKALRDIETGEQPKYIQAQMGYYSINVKIDTYGHLTKPVKQSHLRG